MTSYIFIYQPLANSIDEFIETFVNNNSNLNCEACLNMLHRISAETRKTTWHDYQTQSRVSSLTYIQNFEIIADLFYNQGLSADYIYKKLSLDRGNAEGLRNTLKSFFRPRSTEEEILAKKNSYKIRNLYRRNVKIIGAESEIIRMYLSGMSMSMIAGEFAVNLQSIENILYESKCVDTISQAYAKQCADIRTRENTKNRTPEQKRQSLELMRETRKRNNSKENQRRKTIDTIRKRYNDPTIICVSQVPSIHEKQQRYRYKEYQFKDGRIINVQGFEPKALAELEQIYTLDDIDVRSCIKYICQETNTIKSYFADIQIKESGSIIEVKSDWTLKKYANKNFSILIHMLESKTNFEFWVYNKNSKLIIRNIRELIDFCGYCPLFVKNRLIANRFE